MPSVDYQWGVRSLFFKGIYRELTLALSYRKYNLLQCAHLLMLEKPVELHKIHSQFLNHGYVTATSEYSDIVHTQDVLQH